MSVSQGGITHAHFSSKKNEQQQTGVSLIIRARNLIHVIHEHLQIMYGEGVMFDKWLSLVIKEGRLWKFKVEVGFPHIHEGKYYPFLLLPVPCIEILTFNSSQCVTVLYWYFF
ncbi:hypothetical protein TNCV_3352431 [Trichonephila clavipes]|nr:hypothetical protein TNCV_3352431 [Trichonephila clavipes]